MPDIENIQEENYKEQTNSLPDRQAGNEQIMNENISQHQPIEQTETTNQTSEITKLEIENMEVHKHPHHVMHKKKWTEYLLEFSMLFLAVFLGFIAENIRENITDHDRDKQYML